MFLKTDEIAKFFGRNPQTIYKWINRGWIKPVVLQVGASRYYHFTIDCLVAFFNGQLSRAEIETRLAEIKSVKAANGICKWNKQ